MTRDLNETLIFAKVVEHGSFVSAARALRLPKTTVSRKVQELETRLGAQLLHRTTRKVSLTPAGRLSFTFSVRPGWSTPACTHSMAVSGIPY